MVRRVLVELKLNTLVGPIMVLPRLKNDAVFYEVSDAFAVVAPHATAVVPGHLHGDAAACDWLEVGRMRKAADINGLYLVPHVVQSKVSLFVASELHPLILGRKCLENNIRLPLVNRLPDSREVDDIRQGRKLSRRGPDRLRSMLVLISFSWHTLLASLVWL